jgi:hypothetical protein
VAVNVEHGGAVFFGVDNVFVPDLVVERAWHVLSLNAARYFKRSVTKKPAEAGFCG